MGYATFKTVGCVTGITQEYHERQRLSQTRCERRVFNTKQYRFDVQYAAIRANSINNMDTRVVNLTFNYKFGNKNVKQSKVRKRLRQKRAAPIPPPRKHLF